MRRALEIAAIAELLSLSILLLNLATAHFPAITSLGGPVHGFAYLMVVILTVSEKTASTRAKLLSLTPGIGGLLALRQIRHSSGSRRAGSPTTSL
ncbi:hypothetical protein FB565_008851 [Actinoplanes lutulentus]|uniref:DUF3817 domain-containing protein n=1 Tax=Actinoplanes lutulentus TaxID=1287878 RepID=A0A327Z6Q8_9ACTN|nr:DUF3817 domain-containing protein [Actinoplanes lutulentus]MBB2949046.1 hypothetical protein [Actinoplanes lutulentus]RAK31369.1 hypothetical protein B0I29_115176 [Actinoplanes lutulentus]